MEYIDGRLLFKDSLRVSKYIEIYNFLELFHADVFCIQKEQYDAD